VREGNKRGLAEGAVTETPHPGCFAKRVWICLIAKELMFFCDEPFEAQGKKEFAAVRYDETCAT